MSQEPKVLPSTWIDEKFCSLYNKNRMGEMRNHSASLEIKVRAIVMFLDEQAKKGVFIMLLLVCLVSPVMAQEYKECISEGQKITILDPTSNRQFFFRKKYYLEPALIQKTTLNGEEGWLIEWTLAGDKVKS